MFRWCIIALVLLHFDLLGQGEQVWLHPNRGQWDERINYKVDLFSGEMLIENKGFTYFFYEKDGHNHSVASTTSTSSANEGNQTSHYRTHGIHTTFINASNPNQQVEKNKSNFYRNYFLGNDQSKWKSKVHSIQEITAKQVYNGIDLVVEGKDGGLKYTWIVAPGKDVNTIQWKYEGADGVSINSKGELVITHSLGKITEGKPIAWTLKNGRKIPVSIEYILENNRLHFGVNGKTVFEDTLIIDPSLTFSTFTGSTADNWGFTAAPDANGNLYAGGIVFGSGYPLLGAYDGSYNGGTIDVGISKFNPTGTTLIYSTYIGGNNSETPHSIVSNATGELFVFGVTGSTNFPMAGASLDNTYNGGPPETANGIDFSGSDMYVARFSADGATLLASTYIGGSSRDGLNEGALNYNYGDAFRGEIIVDATNVYISSVTNSPNFPTFLPAQGSLNGSQDAVIMKLNYGLSAFTWSTYFGGSGNDSGNGIEFSSTGNVYITGGTSSPSLSFASGHDLSFNGGQSDGYIALINGTTGASISGTFIGTGEYDQSYFVQVDSDDEVYIFGQSSGSIPISTGRYGNANSGQFVAQYSSNLSTLNWTTSIGSGSGEIEISPTAFLVSNCKDIYLSGWGGTVNSNNSLYAIFSSSNGFPTTSDAFQSTTNGSNFWIGVLDEDATSLKYATYMGGSASSSNHVDGGTSRFDKNGSIYHAVCAACGGNNSGFTTTPGVWSTQNPSPNCNLAAFKFELNSIEALIGDPEPIICLPDPVVFQNNTANGNAFFWDFGDGTTSTEINPSHLYAGPGQYTVTLVVIDTNNCFAPDSIEFEVNIGDFTIGIDPPTNSICPGDSYQFDAFGGTSYLWSPGQFLDDSTIFNPTATVNQTTEFQCIVSDSCGVDTVFVTLTVFGGSVDITDDASICLGQSIQLETTGIVTVAWSPPTFLDNPSSLNPISTPTSTITYTITGTTVDGCELNEDVTITVFFDPPVPVLDDTVHYCNGLSEVVTTSGGDTYAWSPPISITPLTGSTVTISSTVERYYYCDYTNACGTRTDSIFVDLIFPNITAGADTIICPGDTAILFAYGGILYTWDHVVADVDTVGAIVKASPNSPTNYIVTGIDQYGCLDTAAVFVNLYPQPFIETIPDIKASLGDQLVLSATSSSPGAYTWSPPDYLSCTSCQSPVAQPNQNYTYLVSYTDENGCVASDPIQIIYEAIIYVPNAFTPDGDQYNNEFFAIGSNIRDFSIEIYNRWGELIYTGGSLDKAWDGMYRGLKSPDGVYVWKIQYSDFLNEEYSLVGHVNLLR